MSFPSQLHYPPAILSSPLHIYTGVAFQYLVEQIGMWAVLHAFLLFFGVAFPLKYREIKISGRLRYAHIISVLLALLIPLPSALIPLKDGFLNTRNPIVACFGRNSDHIYYTFVLPVSFILGVASCLLMLTFWMIFKVSRKLLQWQLSCIKLTGISVTIYIISYMRGARNFQNFVRDFKILLRFPRFQAMNSIECS